MWFSYGAEFQAVEGLLKHCQFSTCVDGVFVFAQPLKLLYFKPYGMVCSYACSETRSLLQHTQHTIVLKVCFSPGCRPWERTHTGSVNTTLDFKFDFVKLVNKSFVYVCLNSLQLDSGVGFHSVMLLIVLRRTKLPPHSNIHKKSTADECWGPALRGAAMQGGFSGRSQPSSRSSRFDEQMLCLSVVTLRGKSFQNL